GIILEREDDVKRALAKAGFKVQERMNMGEWVAFKLTR
ncbi:MAG: 50S ribosomal protein L11 methyltransferase, partial [Clostridia bacterium]|nr:50S ribosomal protein L11 methyltransferase [Clostridia bacterium]